MSKRYDEDEFYSEFWSWVRRNEFEKEDDWDEDEYLDIFKEQFELENDPYRARGLSRSDFY